MAFELGQPEPGSNIKRQVDGPLIRKLSISNFRNYAEASLKTLQSACRVIGK